jgi:cold shock protein
MKTGTIKFFNEQKGYGFLVDESTNKEVFLHVTGLLDEIKQGDSVTFSLKEGKKGVNAVDIRRVEVVLPA